MILASHIFPPPVPSRNVGHPCRRLRHPSRSRSPELRELACRGNALPLLPDEAPALHTLPAVALARRVTIYINLPRSPSPPLCCPAWALGPVMASVVACPSLSSGPPTHHPSYRLDVAHDAQRRAAIATTNAPAPSRTMGRPGSPSPPTTTPSTRTPKPRPSRTVSTMTPAQLARKRMQDREAQRAIRSRTRDHIERLEKEIRELRVVMAAKPGASNEDTVRELCRRNGVLEEELARLREYLSAGKLAPAYAPSDLAVAHAMAATAPFDAACTFPTALDASPVYEYDARAGTGFYPEPPTAPPPPPSARSSLGQCAPAAPRYGFHVGEAGPWSAPAFGPAMAVPDQPFQPPPANGGSSNMTAAAPTPLSTPRPTHTCTCAAASPACRDGDGYASTQFGALEDAKAWVAAPTPFGQPKHHAA
ncbi:hypothetical protein RJ55_04612 [Drechmeria coniospora]|nr:hypothetical protein RJ55_04612 [Drechmeria coniospora]